MTQLNYACNGCMVVRKEQTKMAGQVNPLKKKIETMNLVVGEGVARQVNLLKKQMERINLATRTGGGNQRVYVTCTLELYFKVINVVHSTIFTYYLRAASGPSNIKPVEAKEGVENKSRVCLRRRSARFKPQESETTEDVFMVDNTNFLVPSRGDDEVHLSGLLSSDSLVKKEPNEGCMIPGNEAQVLRRAYTGRPLRRAAEKVQSYKEMKVNVKMHREL
ncbi:Shugoshin C terminus, putative isoform 2 [Hibiscus syriacus]|uniref:Shugoshin C terminus, putative isoform 2 n=1 Tax=Hibiscus syriacus TaxID=106335 RepID=A0A6A2YRS8_HIBSY|nr:Shugoshin C terminus, putative isoform 2 [Hibiscus syriacus]